MRHRRHASNSIPVATITQRTGIGTAWQYFSALVSQAITMSGLISNPAAIWLAVTPVDMRRGINGLSMLVQQALGHAPCSGAAFVFRNRSGNRIKVVIWDGTGGVVVPAQLA